MDISDNQYDSGRWGKIMTIDWANFTPMASLAGGVLVGVAALLLMLVQGRIMGVSGIAGQLVRAPASKETGWRLAFIIGLLMGPFLVQASLGQIESVFVADGTMLAAAGLIVGIGTAIGSGCTSGHGICGISRLSMRSIAATCVFVAFGMITVFVVGG